MKIVANSRSVLSEQGDIGTTTPGMRVLWSTS